MAHFRLWAKDALIEAIYFLSLPFIQGIGDVLSASLPEIGVNEASLEPRVLLNIHCTLTPRDPVAPECTLPTLDARVLDCSNYISFSHFPFILSKEDVPIASVLEIGVN